MSDNHLIHNHDARREGQLLSELHYKRSNRQEPTGHRSKHPDHPYILTLHDVESLVNTPIRKDEY